jgi:ubiquinone/menaquinone biosynthesis C-methylase UbiE
LPKIIRMASSKRVREIYERNAASYDAALRSTTLETMRKNLFSKAVGDVLELGIGTGATIGHYQGISSLTGLDLSAAMIAQARQKARDVAFKTDFRVQDFQTLEFQNASFDTISSSLGLCGISEPETLFLEIRRVLKPNGKLLALEHVRPPNAFLGLLADAINPVWDHFVGCHPNRKTVGLLENSGFRVQILEQHFLGVLIALECS